MVSAALLSRCAISSPIIVLLLRTTKLAAAAGAIVISTSSSDEKLKLAKQWGASHTINYATTPAWEKEVLRLTGGKGVDHVIEVAGSSTIEQSLQSTKRGGLISLVGFLTDSKPVDLIPSIIFGGKICEFILLSRLNEANGSS